MNKSELNWHEDALIPNDVTLLRSVGPTEDLMSFIGILRVGDIVRLEDETIRVVAVLGESVRVARAYQFSLMEQSADTIFGWKNEMCAHALGDKGIVIGSLEYCL